MSEDYVPSDALMDLALFALEHGFRSIADGKSGPLIPFVMTDTASGRNLHRHVADTLEASTALAHAQAASLGPEVTRYAIATDGFVTIGGARTDAILVEAAERGALSGVTLCQRYTRRPGLFKRPLETVGNPALIGQAPQRFLGAA